jgi:hypothetical protein
MGRLKGQVAWDDSAVFYGLFRTLARVLGNWNIRLNAGRCLSVKAQFWAAKKLFCARIFRRKLFLEEEKCGSVCVRVKQWRVLGRENPRRWTGVWGTRVRQSA